MSDYLTVNSTTAEDQIIRIAWRLKEHYDNLAQQPNQGGVERYGSRVQIDLDFNAKEANLRFRVDVDFERNTELIFKGIDPRPTSNIVPE